MITLETGNTYRPSHGRLYAPEHGLSFIVPDRDTGGWRCHVNNWRDLRFSAHDSPARCRVYLRDDASESAASYWVGADLYHQGQRLEPVNDVEQSGGLFSRYFEGDEHVGTKAARIGFENRGLFVECTVPHDHVDDMTDLSADLIASVWFLVKAEARPPIIQPHHCLAFLFWVCANVDHDLPEAEILKVGERLETWWDPPSNDVLLQTLRETLLWCTAAMQSVDLTTGEMNFAVQELLALQNFGPDLRKAFVEDIARVALADGEASGGEKAYLGIIAKALGVGS